jgi:2-dehydro-3-deoxyphosphogluconate aldolase / (4S)-4-hydroxy-2-oxoglutarate aldolase
MARFLRMDVYNAILEGGMLPLFYQGEKESAIEIATACAQGGAKVIEFTNRGEMAYPVFCDLIQHFRTADPSIMFGVGSVIDSATAALFIAAGANFIVGPSLQPDVARQCNRQKIAYFPGCATATEISQAEELGAEICKVFPGEQVGGPGFISALMAPGPWHRLMPTGGVDATEESVAAWINAGAAAVGMGSKLITTKAVAAKDFGVIAQGVAQIRFWVKKARGAPLFEGLEHIGLIPHGKVSAADLVKWYETAFHFKAAEGNSSYFISGSGPGRIEVDKDASIKPTHIAIRVSNFEEAIAVLKAKGIELEEPTVKPTSKTVYLKNADPNGNLVHILWTNR